MKTKPNVGDRVRWTSQSNGRTTTKEGIVVYSGLPVFNRRQMISNSLPEEVRTARNSHVMFDSVSSGVVVKVTRLNDRNKKSATDYYYAPRLSNLEVIG